MDKFNTLCQALSDTGAALGAQFSASKALVEAQLQHLKSMFQSEFDSEQGHHAANLSTALSVFDRSERCRLALIDQVAGVVRTRLAPEPTLLSANGNC
jgi:hypothetical protein